MTDNEDQNDSELKWEWGWVMGSSGNSFSLSKYLPTLLNCGLLTKTKYKHFQAIVALLKKFLSIIASTEN